MPTVDGTYQSVVKGKDKAEALKSFDSDARQTCRAPQTYGVIKQDVVDNAPTVTSKSSLLNSALAVAAAEDRKHQQYLEVTTVFKCQ